MTDHRAIVLITEGAAPDLVDRWSDDFLPNFKRLRAGHVTGPLRSEFVPYEPSGLASAFTGHPPDAHGCFSYWDVHSPNYEPKVLSGAFLRRPFLWQRPEFAGLSVAIVNVFGTHPVEPVNGYCIGYPMRRTMHACHPRDLPIRLSREGVKLIHDVTVWFTGESKDEFVDRVLEADRQRAAATIALLDGKFGPEPQLTVLNLTSIDRLSHGYWCEVEPDAEVPDEEAVLLRAYRLADEVLGQLLDRVDEATSVLAFSEIGFGRLNAFCSVNDALEAGGLLRTGRTGEPDWESTLAFEAVQGSHGVNLNLSSRYRCGTIAARDRDRMIQEVTDVLAAYRNPHTERPLFTAVVASEGIYTGESAGQAPDVILVPSDWEYLPLGDPFWSRKTNRHLQTGWHRQDSYWGGAGPAFTRTEAEAPATTIDIAPTVTAMVGLRPIDDFAGTRLGGTE